MPSYLLLDAAVMRNAPMPERFVAVIAAFSSCSANASAKRRMSLHADCRMLVVVDMEQGSGVLLSSQWPCSSFSLTLGIQARFLFRATLAGGIWASNTFIHGDDINSA